MNRTPHENASSSNQQGSSSANLAIKISGEVLPEVTCAPPIDISRPLFQLDFCN